MSEPPETDWLSALERDHQVIHTQLTALRRAVRQVEQQPESPTLQGVIRQLSRFFTTDWIHHIRLEEEALFPVLIPIFGQNHGPLVAVRMEHEELPQILRQWEGAREQFAQETLPDQWKALKEATEHLTGLLAVHLDKEDRVLFPLARKLLEARDWAEVQERGRILEGKR